MLNENERYCASANGLIGDNQLLNLPPDKCDLILSLNRAIIKQKNVSSDGVQGHLQPCLQFLARNTPMPAVCV